MTRAVVLAVLGAATACDSARSQSPRPGRTDTTKVARKPVSTDAFCDVQFGGASGPMFTMPALTGAALAPPSASAWRWVNVWATWCKPCIEEMPRLATWRSKLGRAYELSFISVDGNDADLAAFRADHPDAPASARLSDPATQGDWLVALGLDAAAPVPIHIFVEPHGHVRCARAGGVREQDFEAVQKVLSD